MRVRRSSDWADLVFHVLAHVRGTAHLAPSLYDREYVAFSFRAVGPSAERALAEDAAVLGQTLATHDALAAAQLLAWLFASLARARAADAKDVAELTRDDVDAPELLGCLRAIEPPGLELLRCAAALEADAHARLPSPEFEEASLAWAFADASRVAPELARCDVVVARALRLRGRVFGREIWVGAPSESLGLTVEHVAWQASHEATVREVSLAAALPHSDLEHASVVLLAERARAAGRDAAHARWLAHLGSNAPSTDRSSLRPDVASVVSHVSQRSRHGH